MNGNQLYCRFSDKVGSAGRPYGHWVQHFPSKLRQDLAFNGRTSVERDFSTMQLTLLYGLVGMTPLPGDLYDFDGMDRHLMKAILTKSVGARSRIVAIAAMRKDMKEFAPALMAEAEIYFYRFL